MPCYDPRPSEDLSRLENQNERLTGIICALVNELDRRGITVDVVSEAQRHGKIEIFPFIKKHMNEDINRLAFDITSRYSKDELAIIKKLIP